MKKFYFLTAVAAIGMMAGCSKQNQPSEPTLPENERNTPVLFSLGSPMSEVKTKSTGSAGSTVEAENLWAGQQLFVYAFSRDVTDFTTPPFINNVSTTAPEGVSTGTLTLDNPKYPGEPFYYGTAKAYDFYGYHVDDAATAAPTVEAGRIVIPIEINGGQDIMIAKADPETDRKGNDKVTSNDRVYSAYSARRGVQPTLKFEHMLSRFTFNIVAGAASGNDVKVTSVKMKSKYKGGLEVVGANRGLAPEAVAANDEKGVFTLKDYDAASKTLVVFKPVAPKEWVEERNNSTKIGESLMVIPGEASYEITVELGWVDEAKTSPIDPQIMHLNIGSVKNAEENAPTTHFAAGYSYDVTIVIYGPEAVKLKAELTPWKNGGDITVDPDEDEATTPAA